MNKNKIKILHLEDNNIDAESIKRLIKKESLPYNLTSVSTCEKAREEFAKDNFDLVLLDSEVPDGSGMDLLKDFSHVPCIIVTGQGNEDIAVQALKNGAKDYLVKDSPGMYLHLLPTVIQETLGKYQKIRNLEAEAEQLSKFPSENPNPVLRVGRDLKLIYANSKAQILLSEFKCNAGQTVPENYCKAIREALNKMSSSVFETFHENRYFSFDVVQVPEHDYLNFYGRDITEKRKTALALQENEARVRSIIELAVDSIITISESGKIKSINPSTVRTFQYTEKELIGQNICTLIPQALTDHPDNQILNKSGNIFPRLVGEKHEFWGRRKDGKVFPLSSTVSGIFSDHERSFTLFMRDILKQKNTESALQESKERISKIIETALDAIIMMDDEGKITAWNEQAKQIFGWDEEETMGKTLANLIIPVEFRQAHKKGLDKYLKTGEGPVLNSRIEITGLRKNGDEFPIELSITPIIHGNKITFSGFLRDLTEKKIAEQELQDAIKAARASSKAKSEFLANTSHEIRTPLNAITGFSQILLKLLNQKKVGKDFEEYLGIIIRSGENLTEVINNVLDLSKIESGKMEILKETFDLKVVIKSLIAIYKHQAMEKGLELEYRFDKDLEGLIISDRVKLNQILTNLIGNSLKFTAKGFIHISAKKQGKNILFSVKDSGIGVPANRIDDIFKAFEQADTSMTRNYGGTGLGLAITQKMSELLGGRIWLESEEGKYSNFYFEIPLEMVKSPTNEDQIKSKVLFSEENKILLVDDNEDNLLLTKLILEEFGLKPILARNGIEAIKNAIKISPDLILMDLQMPKMDGLEATKQIRNVEEIKNTPIVGLSAHALKEHEEDALKAGLDDYLTKPLDSNKLEKVCLKFLNSK
jgi:PAS domain S-box-containing protein